MQKRQLHYLRQAGAGISANPLILKLCAMDVFFLAWAWSYGSWSGICQLIPQRWTQALALPTAPAWRGCWSIAVPALLVSSAGAVAILLLAHNLRRKKHRLIENMRRFRAAAEQARAIETRTATTGDSSDTHPLTRRAGAQERQTSVWPAGHVSRATQ
jgi:hypothetical protein